MTDNFKSSEIAELYAIFENGVAENDIEMLLSKFYSSDVAFVGTGLPLTQGKVVADVLGGLCNAVDTVSVEQLKTLIVEPDKVMIDFAVINGQGKDGTAVSDRSTCVFHKRAEGWRCVADIFVRD